MRVAHLLPDGGAIGGVRRVVDALCALDAVDHELHVVTAPGLPARRLRTGWPLPLPLLDGALLRALSAVDVVVVHGVFSPGAARVSRALHRSPRRPRVVAFPHDPYDDGLFSSRTAVKRAYFTAVERPRLVRSDGVLVTAPSHEQLLRRRGVRTPVLVRPLGLATDERAAAARVRDVRPARPRDGLRLLFVGRWDVHEKGLDLLLPAVRALADAVPAVRLRLVGPTYGADAEVAALVERTGAPVDLVGFVDDVWAELAQADLVVQPSRKEGFGLAALQALAAGVPVLLATVAGLAEVVGESDGARLVRPTPDDVSSGLAGAVRDLDDLERAAQAFAVTRAPRMTYDAVLAGLLELARVGGAGSGAALRR